MSGFTVLHAALLFIYLFLQLQHSALMGELGYRIIFSIQLGTDLHPAATGQGRIWACLLGTA